jgi:hypothetical protein
MTLAKHQLIDSNANVAGERRLKRLALAENRDVDNWESREPSGSAEK